MKAKDSRCSFSGFRPSHVPLPAPGEEEHNALADETIKVP